MLPANLGDTSDRSMKPGTRWVGPSVAMSAVSLTVFDRQVTRVHAPRIFVYPRGLPVARLVETLPHALAAYAPLAGRLRGRSIEPGTRGVKLVIADHGVTTPRRIAPDEAPRMLARCVAAPGRDSPLATVQINRMRDGGAILGFANNHCVMDGTSCYRFLGHWAALARGDAEPPGPCHRRAELEALCRTAPAAAPETLGLRRAGARELASLVANVVAARALFGRMLLEFSGEVMARLKARAWAEQPAGSTAVISSNTALAAHLWQVLDEAGAGLPLAMVTDARGTVGELGGRRYFGNFNDLAIVPGAAGASLGQRAAALRDVTAGLAGERILARGRVLLDVEAGAPRVFPAGVLDTLRGAPMINNWSRFPIFELDFGSGKPGWFDIPVVPLRRMVIVTAHPDDSGGRLVHLTVKRADREALMAPAMQRRLFEP